MTNGYPIVFALLTSMCFETSCNTSYGSVGSHTTVPQFVPPYKLVVEKFTFGVLHCRIFLDKVEGAQCAYYSSSRGSCKVFSSSFEDLVKSATQIENNMSLEKDFILEKGTRIVPIHGGWSGWSSWSIPCTSSCNSCIRSRTRSCDNPVPTFGGCHCPGKPKHEEKCSDRCPNDWIEFGNSAYCIDTTARSWPAARDACERRDATLVAIETEEEIIADAYFTSARELSPRNWTWTSTGQPLSQTYTNWADGQGLGLDKGVQDCQGMSVDQNYLWHDYPAESTQAFSVFSVCEKAQENTCLFA